MIESETMVNSPCVDICRLDDKGLCIGCLRTVLEISQWPYFNDHTKQEILLAIKKRKEGVYGKD